MELYRDADASINILQDKIIGVLGFGNQGRSQALNMRDSGLKVLVADIDEHARSSAQDDGLSVVPIRELVKTSDFILVLLPDDQIPEVFNSQIVPEITRGKTIVFASGYVVAFNLITIPEYVDVLLMAPRMIGKGIRTLFLEGIGFATLIAIENDASGNSMENLLALTKAIGGTKGGAFVSSFKEEAIIDLFFEQTGELYAFRTMFEVLIEAGFSPEIVLLDMYGSGELIESYTAVRDIGLWRQLKVHSMASQYGQEVVALREFDIEAARKSYQKILGAIIDGSFTRSYQQESRAGFPQLNSARKDNMQHPMQQAEDTVYTALGRRSD